MKIRTLALALFASTALVACSSYGSRPAAPAMISGGMLVGSNGMTLYTFDKDVTGSGKSVCNDACATNWPPLFATADAAPSGDYSIVTRDDGKKQWAMKGKPLYYWIKDQKAGDKTGDGVNSVWHIIKP
jgi:predicted lipoprotein with Yx(FWY)xxD motif